ncbi:sterol carrier family protein [Phytoactinopolyspora limicola]|uniref:sterol carrier family protein n=1 Tax=Phytoactinopolyspora limicola TaxID=2715536 RepID=UPI00140CE9B6|nr:sterol carrier family protein [Phytoactinopolyspora limicola]
MAKRIDPDVVWSTYYDGYQVLREWLVGLPHRYWGHESVLPGWTVTELAAHLVSVVGRVGELTPAARSVDVLTASQYVLAYDTNAGVVADEARAIAAAARSQPDRVVAAIDDALAVAVGRMEQLTPGDPVVAGRRGAIRLSQFLLTRVIEIVTHADDLARSVREVEPPAMPRSTQRTGVRALLDMLAERVPGRTVEVRVPPYAAVQCIEGPRHTRGTPPNIVEMDAATWIRLATGRVAWDVEAHAGRISASGERANLAGHLPLL